MRSQSYMSKPNHWFQPGSPAATTSVAPRNPLSNSDSQFNVLRGGSGGQPERRGSKSGRGSTSLQPSLKPVPSLSSFGAKPPI